MPCAACGKNGIAKFITVVLLDSPGDGGATKVVCLFLFFSFFKYASNVNLAYCLVS